MMMMMINTIYIMFSKFLRDSAILYYGKTTHNANFIIFPYIG
jgi:hypothetical protein